jgi:hypothetical protein
VNIFGSTEHPTEVRTEQGLGWSLSGEKGKVRVIAELPRPDWVAGQNVWIKIFADNQSQKKVRACVTGRMPGEYHLIRTCSDTNPQYRSAGTSRPVQTARLEAGSRRKPFRPFTILGNTDKKEDLRRDS